MRLTETRIKELKREIKCSCDKSKLSPLDIKLEPIDKEGNCITFIRRVSCSGCGSIKQDVLFEYERGGTQ